VLQNNLRLAGKDACESLAVITIDGLEPLSEFDAISIHRIALTVPKAAVLSRGRIQGFQKKLIWGAHVVISKEFRNQDVVVVFLNDTICRDNPVVFSVAHK
jgi:hypothetical protein